MFGHPHGELYVQGLALALLGVLSQAHARCAVPAERRARQLSASQRRRVVDLVAAQYGAALSLTWLAAELGFSP